MYIMIDIIKEEEFIKNLESISLVKLVKQEKLSLDFICNYVLKEKYQITPEEKEIDIFFVLAYQTHITLDNIKKKT